MEGVQILDFFWGGGGSKKISSFLFCFCNFFARRSNLKLNRGFSGVDVWCVEISHLHLTGFLPYYVFQVIFTDIGFHLKSGFRKRLSTQTVDFTLNLVSQNSYLH